MSTEKIIAEAMKELKSAEVYEHLASQSRCKARKLLESVSPNGSPVPSGRKRGINSAEAARTLAQRRKNVLRKAK